MTGKILKFSSVNSDIEYKLDDRTGYFVNTTNPQDQKGEMDFICEPGYVITSVKYPNQANGKVYNIDDEVATANSTSSFQIHGFDIRKNILTVLSEDEEAPNDGIVPITSIRSYVNNQQLINDANTFFTELEDLILRTNTRRFRLTRILKNRRETPKDFLIKFFKGTGDMEQGWNYSRNTIYIDNEEIQTQMGKRRSLGDIFIIMKYYYPNITLKEVVKLLYVDLFTVMGENPGLRTSICNQINKRVWYYEDTQSAIMNSTVNDEYGNNFEYYKTKLNNLTLTV